MQLQLIKKGFITEKVLRTCNDEGVVHLDISSINITSSTKEITKAIITSKGKTYQATFTK